MCFNRVGAIRVLRRAAKKVVLFVISKFGSLEIRPEPAAGQ